MKSKDVIIAHPSSSDKSDALKAFMKSQRIRFEVANDIDKYNLTSEQKTILDERRMNATSEKFFSIDEVNKRLKEKYAL